jgi:protein tyrosine phosphatase (PTP) superfamily phosphohydrolase (DUF442 family)
MTRSTLGLLAFAGLLIASGTLGGCHTASQCPILQGMAGWTIPSPLPMPSENYTVIGYRDGIRFYVMKYDDTLYRSGDIMTAQGADNLKQLGIKTIITTSQDADQKSWAEAQGMKYVEIPFGWNDMTEADLHSFLAAYDANPKPVCVISRTGTIRAGIFGAWYRVRRQGWPVDKAIYEYNWQLQANVFDSIPIVNTFRSAAASAPAPAAAPAPAPAARP